MPTQKETYTGTISIRGKKNIGFVNVPGLEGDLVVPQNETGTALDGDTVEVALSGNPVPAGKAPEAVLIRLISRAREEYIGTIVETEGRINFVADGKMMHIHPSLENPDKALIGKKVAVKLVRWVDAHTEPIVAVIDVLGPVGDHETEMRALIRIGGFVSDFPPEVQKEADDIYAHKDQIFADAVKDPKRRDMRSSLTFTIDPKDAKDFDDALSVTALPNGNYEIGIHIADVSHYVTPGTAIDAEALKRGTSVYMVDRVIPMLPEVLSNDLCSIRPHEDRLAFSAVFEMNNDAQIVNEWYGQTIIHSDHRFTYEDAQAVLDAGSGDHFKDLKVLMDLGRLMRTRRFANGSIAFDSEEVRFELDAEKRPIRVYVKTRVETMLMIEDFMLLANTKVAEHINKLAKEGHHDAVFVYRIHDTPDTDRIEELAAFLKMLGHELKNNHGIVKAEDINKLLKDIQGTPEEALIKTATIRSMAKAIYSTKNIGHFGLAFKYYTHFTSPIRRYPDLMVHRLLRAHIDGTPISKQESAHYEAMSIQNSESEMKAARVERDSIKYKQVEYMSTRIGQTFDGVISGISDWGVFVQDNVSKAEGLIRINALGNDFYENVPGKYEIRGKRTGKRFRLGDPIRIKLVAANLEEKMLDFALA